MIGYQRIVDIYEREIKNIKTNLKEDDDCDGNANETKVLLRAETILFFRTS